MEKWTRVYFLEVLAMEPEEGVKHPAQEDKTAELRDCGKILPRTKKREK